jgi:ATP-dependent phosphoenolpyruvate carboxykinase
MTQVLSPYQSRYGLDLHGVQNSRAVFWNLSTPALYEAAIARAEGHLSNHGPLVVSTGQFTGRTPKDKYIVYDEVTRDLVWWGPVNAPLAPEHFVALRQAPPVHWPQREQYSHSSVTRCAAGYAVGLRHRPPEYELHRLLASPERPALAGRLLDNYDGERQNELNL